MLPEFLRVAIGSESILLYSELILLRSCELSKGVGWTRHVARSLPVRHLLIGHATDTSTGRARGAAAAARLSNFFLSLRQNIKKPSNTIVGIIHADIVTMLACLRYLPDRLRLGQEI